MIHEKQHDRVTLGRRGRGQRGGDPQTNSGRAALVLVARRRRPRVSSLGDFWSPHGAMIHVPPSRTLNQGSSLCVSAERKQSRRHTARRYRLETGRPLYQANRCGERPAYLAEDRPHGRVLLHREPESHDRVKGRIHSPFSHAFLKLTCAQTTQSITQSLRKASITSFTASDCV